MKHTFKLLLLLSASALHGQTPDTARLIKLPKQPLSLCGAGFGLASGSNGLNQYMLYRLALGGYMPTEQIEKAEGKIKDNNRTGIVSSAYLYAALRNHPDTGWRKPWRVKPNEVELLLLNFTGATYGKGAFQLVFRGNGNYLGQTLDFGNSGFRQYGLRTLNLNFDEAFLSKKTNGLISFGFSLGFSQLTSYRSMNITKGTLYTDSNRNYVEAKYSGTYDNAGRNATAGVGYGLVTGIDLRWNMNTTRYSFRISNLGAYYVPELQQLKKEMADPARVNQTKIGLKSLNTDNWIDGLKDSINQGLAPDTTESSKLVMSPFAAYLSMMTGKAMISLEYVRLPGFMPRLSISPLKAVLKIKKLSMKPELQLGGFDTYNINLKFYAVTKLWGKSKNLSNSFYLNLLGLEGMVLPKLEHGAGLTFGLSCLLN